MSIRHSNDASIEWKQQDVRHMTEIESDSIDVAFDKGTLDAMIHGSPFNPPEDVVKNTSQYVQEVSYNLLLSPMATRKASSSALFLIDLAALKLWKLAMIDY